MYFGEENRSIEVLLVEDNPGDVRLMREAFWEVDVRHCLHTASDGVEAIDSCAGATGTRVRRGRT